MSSSSRSLPRAEPSSPAGSPEASSTAVPVQPRASWAPSDRPTPTVSASSRDSPPECWPRAENRWKGRDTSGTATPTAARRSRRQAADGSTCRTPRPVPAVAAPARSSSHRTGPWSTLGRSCRGRAVTARAEPHPGGRGSRVRNTPTDGSGSATRTAWTPPSLAQRWDDSSTKQPRSMRSARSCT